MLTPFSNHPVNQTYERLLAQELAARAHRPQEGLLARIVDILFGGKQPTTQA